MSTTSRCRWSSTHSRRWRRTRRSCGPTAARTSRTTTSGTGSRGTVRRRPTRSRHPRCASRSDIYIPRIHVASIETCGCVADWDPVHMQLTLHMTTQAPHAIRTVAGTRRRAVPACPSWSTTSGSRPTTSAAASAARCPVYPGYVLAVAASFLIGKPVKWIEDRSENLQADSFARDYHIDIELGGDEGRQDPGAQGQDPCRPRLRRRGGRPLEVPGRALQRHHRLATTSTTPSSRSTAPTPTSRPAASPTAARSA